MWTMLHENMMNISLLLTVTYTDIRSGEALGLELQNINFKNYPNALEHKKRKICKYNLKQKRHIIILVDKVAMKQLEPIKLL